MQTSSSQLQNLLCLVKDSLKIMNELCCTQNYIGKKVIMPDLKPVFKAESHY